MNAKYVSKKTGKMATQTVGSNAVALAVYYALKRFGVELGAEEMMIYMAAMNIMGNSSIKFIEKVKKKKDM